jgi:hypothetical protein
MKTQSQITSIDCAAEEIEVWLASDSEKKTDAIAYHKKYLDSVYEVMTKERAHWDQVEKALHDAELRIAKAESEARS